MNLFLACLFLAATCTAQISSSKEQIITDEDINEKLIIIPIGDTSSAIIAPINIIITTSDNIITIDSSQIIPSNSINIYEDGIDIEHSKGIAIINSEQNDITSNIEIKDIDTEDSGPIKPILIIDQKNNPIVKIKIGPTTIETADIPSQSKGISIITINRK